MCPVYFWLWGFAQRFDFSFRRGEGSGEFQTSGTVAGDHIRQNLQVQRSCPLQVL